MWVEIDYGCIRASYQEDPSSYSHVCFLSLVHQNCPEPLFGLKEIGVLLRFYTATLSTQLLFCSHTEPTDFQQKITSSPRDNSRITMITTGAIVVVVMFTNYSLKIDHYHSPA